MTSEERTPRRDLTPVEFDAIYSRVPRLSVDLVVQTPQGIVMAKRDIPPHKGDWHLPGGTVAFGEHIPEAAERLAREELGVEITIDRMLGYMEYSSLIADGYQGWPISIVMLASIKSGTPAGSPEGKEVDYFTKAPENTIPDVLNWLNTNYFTQKPSTEAAA
jgi:ADP-ribose pyrophosphatase YjhB (NUDIX family)